MDNLTKAVNVALVNSNMEDEVYEVIERNGTDVEYLANWFQETYPSSLISLPFPFELVATFIYDNIDWDAIAKDWIDGWKRDNRAEEETE